MHGKHATTLWVAALVAGITALGPGAAAGHGFTLGDLTIDHPYAIATAPAAKTGAGYLSITNGGGASDRLLGIRADFPRTEVHVTEVDAEGVARMRPVTAVEIGPGETVTFAPKGLHVMFMGLAEPLETGEKVPATLVFENAGEVAVQFNVESRADAEAHADH